MAAGDPKFASDKDGCWQPHDYGKVYAIEKIGDVDRLCIAASEHGSKLLDALSRVLSEPFQLLYVLVIFRGGGIEGRYQSDDLTRKDLNEMFARYGDFWDKDGTQFGCVRQKTMECR